LWKRRFGSDPAIVGKQVVMKSRPLTVIGVMPPGFEYPEQTQIWVNSAVNLSEEPRDNRAWSAIARLNSNVDLKQAQTRVSAINAQLDKQFHQTNKGWDVSLWTLHERLVREVKPSLLALLGAVGLVLLIACANVANLLLARSAVRQKEIAIRAAMGASRTRVLRQMLTESILLSAIGGIAGFVLSIWLTDVLMSMLPEGAPRLAHIGIDYRVLTFALVVSALTGILFGIVPALQASKLDVTSALKEGGRSGEGHRRTSARSLLLIGEVALSLMLLVGAGFLDLSNRVHPQLAGRTTNIAVINDLQVAGSHAFLACNSGLRIVDVSSRTNPVEIGSWEFPDFFAPAMRVQVAGHIAYVTIDTDPGRPQAVIDVSDPAHPVFLSFLNASTDSPIAEMRELGHYLLAVDFSRFLKVYDNSDPTNITLTASVPTRSRTYGLTVVENYAYVSEGDAAAVQVFDISNPTNLVEVGTFDTRGPAANTFVANKLLYVAEWDKGLAVVPSAPLIQFTVQVDGVPGVPFTIEAATELGLPQAWKSLWTTNSTRMPFWFTDSEVKTGSKFYRVEQ
jgi:hypothetical protein